MNEQVFGKFIEERRKALGITLRGFAAELYNRYREELPCLPQKPLKQGIQIVISQSEVP